MIDKCCSIATYVLAHDLVIGKTENLYLLLNCVTTVYSYILRSYVYIVTASNIVIATL